MLTMSGALDPRVRPDEARRVGVAAPAGRFVLLEGNSHQLGVGHPRWHSEVGAFLAAM